MVLFYLFDFHEYLYTAHFLLNISVGFLFEKTKWQSLRIYNYGRWAV